MSEVVISTYLILPLLILGTSRRARRVLIRIVYLLLGTFPSVSLRSLRRQQMVRWKSISSRNSVSQFHLILGAPSLSLLFNHFQVQLRCSGVGAMLPAHLQILQKSAADAVCPSLLVLFGTDRLPELRLQRSSFHQTIGKRETSRIGRFCLVRKRYEKIILLPSSNSA